MKTVQEGCQAIAETVVEKRTKAREPGCPQGMIKVMRTPAAAAYDVELRMQSMEEDAPEGEARKVDHRPE